MPLRTAIAALVALTATIAIAATVWLTRDQPPATPTAALERCTQLPRGPAARDCFSAAIGRRLAGVRDVTPAIERITTTMARLGSYPSTNCHLIMHAVGRRYAAAEHVTLATLMNYLPHTNDPGCAAGFAHGVITQIAPDILRAGPAASEQVCANAATRYQRYSCMHGLGHAYMRFYNEQLRPSLRLCDALGHNAAPDCAQGAYHDYWLAIAGADDTRRPTNTPSSARALCRTQPEQFVLPCWYRAFIDTRPAGYQTRTPQDLKRICRDTSALQREGCITASAVIGPPNPLRQLRVCTRLAQTDMLPCIRGTKVQNLDANDTRDQLRVVARCGWFPRGIQPACYRWLGKVLAVTTNGTFATTGCPHTADPSNCARGARSYNGPLVTFS